jgi:hypothetical protein
MNHRRYGYMRLCFRIGSRVTSMVLLHASFSICKRSFFKWAASLFIGSHWRVGMVVGGVSSLGYAPAQPANASFLRVGIKLSDSDLLQTAEPIYI